MNKARATKIVGGIGLLVVLALGWAYVLSPRTSALAEVRQQVDEVRSQNDTLRQQIKVLRAQKATLRQVRKTAAALATKFPSTADQPGMFREVTRAAVAAGIPATKVTALTPQAPVPGEPGHGSGATLPGNSTTADLAVQTVTMSVEGTLDEVQRLMRNLEEMPRAYLVTSLTVGAGSEAALYNATITGEMFVMPAALDPVAVATPSPNVAHTSAPPTDAATMTAATSATS